MIDLCLNKLADWPPERPSCYFYVN